MLVGRDRVPPAVPRQERHAPPGDVGQEDRIRRRAIRRVDLDLADVVEERVEARPPEDPDLRRVSAHARLRPSPPEGSTGDRGDSSGPEGRHARRDLAALAKSSRPGPSFKWFQANETIWRRRPDRSRVESQMSGSAQASHGCRNGTVPGSNCWPIRHAGGSSPRWRSGRDGRRASLSSSRLSRPAVSRQLRLLRDADARRHDPFARRRPRRPLSTAATTARAHHRLARRDGRRPPDQAHGRRRRRRPPGLTATSSTRWSADRNPIRPDPDPIRDGFTCLEPSHEWPLRRRLSMRFFDPRAGEPTSDRAAPRPAGQRDIAAR